MKTERGEARHDQRARTIEIGEAKRDQRARMKIEIGSEICTPRAHYESEKEARDDQRAQDESE